MVSVTRRGFLGGVLIAGTGAWSSAAGAAPAFTGPGAAPSAVSGAPGTVALQWNLIAQNTLQPQTPMSPMGSTTMAMSDPLSMPKAFVILSYAHAAMYNAVVAIEGGYQPYMVATTAPAGASAPAAAAAAVHAVLVKFVPTQQEMLDMELWNTLKAVGSTYGDRAKGTAVGRAAAAAILALRADDGLDAVVTVPSSTAPGAWVPLPTMSDPTTSMLPLDPWVAQLKPFVMTTPSQFRPGPPPTLSSRTYVRDLEEVRLYGGKDSTPGTKLLRTTEQSGVALFWQTNGVIQYNEMFRAVAQQRGLGLLEAAHTTFASATAEMLTVFLGTRSIGITLKSTAPMAPPEFSYATAEDLRSQVINARTWGGLHYRNSSVVGNDVGRKVAVHALKNHFKPVGRR